MARLGEARRGRGGEGWPVGSGCKLGMGNAVLNIEWRHPDGLTPYARNPKTHPDDQIAKIAASIASFGFDQPIVIDAEGVIIKGHGRRRSEPSPGSHPGSGCRAQRPLGRRNPGGASRRQQDGGKPVGRGTAPTGNRGAPGRGLRLTLTGFEPGEIDQLWPSRMATQRRYRMTTSFPTSPAEPVTRPGDLWLLGRPSAALRRRTKADDVARLLGGARRT